MEGGVTDEEEDDKDGICFVNFEFRFKNKETVLNLSWALD